MTKSLDLIRARFIPPVELSRSQVFCIYATWFLYIRLFNPFHMLFGGNFSVQVLSGRECFAPARAPAGVLTAAGASHRRHLDDMMFDRGLI